jgi:carbon-monoxide dehydrogenase medium subunit
MKPPPFTLHRPDSLDQAVRWLAELPNARVLAGGQTLVPMLAMRYLYVDHLIDINTLPGLNRIGMKDGDLHVGALVRQRELELSPLVKAHAPIVAEALALVGHVQTRNRGTFVGSLCNMDPASEQPAVAGLLDACIEVAGPRGSRELSFADFAQGFMTTGLAVDEIATAVRLTPWSARHGFAFVEYARRHGDFPIVGVGVMLELDEQRRAQRLALRLIGVGALPIDPLPAQSGVLGHVFDDAAIEDIATGAAQVDALDDGNASRAYRQHLAGALTRRALRKARDRAVAPQETRS